MPTLHAKRFGSKQNAKTWANQFRARLLEPGIISYEDVNQGVSLVSKETIDRCIRTFIGRPLVLARNKYDEPTYKHTPVSPQTLEQIADGYISDVVYDDVDGWWYAVGTVHNDEAKEAIQKVGLVSCAYDVLSIGPGGSYHNIPYTDEITAFEGEHLAIVAMPRYEKATIRLNAKTATTKPIKHMFKWIKSITNALTSKPETVEGELPEGASLKVGEQQIPVAELVATHQRVNGTDGEPLDGASEIALADGKRVTIDQLLASYQKLNAMEEEEAKKKNAADEEEAKKKEMAKKNAAEEEEEKKKKENAEKDEAEKKAKENSKTAPRVYRVNTSAGPLTQARENGMELQTVPATPDTLDARCARGNERYGPKNVTPAK